MKRAQKSASRKKHPNRPRQPVVIPLDDEERMAFAGQEWRKAVTHLAEAELLAAGGTTPNACAHSAYYAMYHAAAAAILASGGVGKRKDVPASHTHVLEHFAKLAQLESGLVEAAAMLSRARTDRDVADYGLDQNLSARDAASTTAEARRFIEMCKTKWSLT